MSEQSITASVEYKDAPGFPGYRVGNDGAVWSCWRRATRGGTDGRLPRVIGPDWRPLALLFDKRGRQTVQLCRGGKVFRRFVHRLVLEAFVGPCPGGMECCHFPDANVANNALSNLRWDTAKSNAGDRVIHGTDGAGERNGRAKLTEAQVVEIRRLAAAGEDRLALAVRFGVRRTNIDSIIHRQTWKRV